MMGRQYDKSLMEKPMENKVIFESEEEFKVIIGLITTASDNSPAMNMYLKNAKICQMIRKSAAEEAEERIRQLHANGFHCDKLGATVEDYSKVIKLIIDDMQIISKGFFELKAKLKKEEK